MPNRRNSRFYVAVAVAALALLLLLLGLDYLSYDRTRFAQQIENRIHEQETEAMHALRNGDWIGKLRAVKAGTRMLSNDLVRQIEALSGETFTVYLYAGDSLLFWSRPGLVIDPLHKEFRQIPCIIRDHRQDYFVRKAEIAEGGEFLQAYFKIPILPDDEQAFSVAVSPHKFGAPTPPEATLIRSIDGSPIAYI